MSGGDSSGMCSKSVQPRPQPDDKILDLVPGFQTGGSMTAKVLRTPSATTRPTTRASGRTTTERTGAGFGRIRSERGPLVVGIGASAGGLEAIKAFFGPIPGD